MATDIYSLYADIFAEKYTKRDHYTTLELPIVDMTGATKFIITPKYEYRPDLVSYDAYGSIAFEEVIMVANKFTDPIKDFYAGRTIYLPTFSVVNNIMSV